MADPPKDAREALSELGVATKTAGGDARNMVDILADVAKATEGLGSADRLAAFTSIAGQEAGAAFAALVNQGGSGEITKFVEIYKDQVGETERVAKQMGNNAAGDIKEFWSAVEGTNIALTETSDAPLRDLIQTATSAVRAIQGWVVENPKLAGTLVQVAAVVAGLIFTGGVLATTVAGLLGPLAMAKFAFTALGIKAGLLGGGFSIVGKGIGFLGTAAKVAFPIVTAGIRAIGMAMAANPILAIIMAIATAAILIYQYWEPIKAFFIDLWAGITEAFGIAWDWITDKLQALAAPIQWVSDALGSLFGGDSEKTLKIEKTGMTGTDAGRAIREGTASRQINLTDVNKMAGVIATSQGAAKGSVEAAQSSQDTYTFNINPPPGSDERKIAQMVREELEAHERRRQSRARSALADGAN